MLKLYRILILFSLVLSLNLQQIFSMEVSSISSKNNIRQEINQLVPDFKSMLNYDRSDFKGYISKLWKISTSLVVMNTLLSHLDVLSHYSKLLVDTSQEKRTFIAVKSSDQIESIPDEEGIFKQILISGDSNTCEQLIVLDPSKDNSTSKLDIESQIRINNQASSLEVYTSKDLQEITYVLNSPEAQSLCMQNLSGFKRFSYTKEYDTYIDNLIANPEKEISLIGKLIRQRIAKTGIRKNSSKEAVLSLLHYLIQSDNFVLTDFNSVTITDLIKNILSSHSIFNAINELIPDFILIFSDFAKINEMFINLNKRLCLSTKKESDEIYDYIVKTLKKYKSKIDYYKSLYLQIEPEIDSIIRANVLIKSRASSEFAFYREMKQQYAKDLMRDYRVEDVYVEKKNQIKKTEIDQGDSCSFIEDLVKPNKKAENKKNKKKNRNRNRRRPHRKQSDNLEKTKKSQKITKNTAQEYFSRPEYAYRIYKWFINPEFIQDKSQDSILYHTYSPIADMFIKKYGKLNVQQNRTYGTQDYAYCMLGQIRYADNTYETVLFVNCYNCTNICYHRGFERANISEILQENLLFSFPNLTQLEQVEEQECKSKSFMLFNLENKQDIYTEKNFKENDFCIYIPDSKNNVTIVLFKPVIF